MVNLGCNPHTRCTGDRDLLDFYVTPSEITSELVKLEQFDENILECAVGMGHIAEVLKEEGYNVTGFDIVDRGYPCTVQDFLEFDGSFDGDVVTNPPFKLGTDFVLKALQVSKRKVAMLFKIQFVEGIDRYKRLFSKYPPARIHVFTRRVGCFKANNPNTSRSAICFAWFIWDKEYEGSTVLNWIDNI